MAKSNPSKEIGDIADKLQTGQEDHSKELCKHAGTLDKQEAMLELICNRAKGDE